MSPDTDNVLQLGRDLAEALNPSDIVGRWMSHHLAELINRCREDPDDEQLAATTREVVLKLWEHKSGAPWKGEPYAYLRPVMRAIERLDPSPAPWAYYRPFDEHSPSVKAMTTYPLLPVACEIDSEVGNLIRLVVAHTARDAISCEEPWVIAGITTAKTEEDRVVSALEQLIHRYSGRGESAPDEPLAVDFETVSLKTTSGTANDESSSTAETDDTEGVETIDDPETTEPLTMAVQAAVMRCRALLDKLSAMSGNGTEENANNTDKIG
ncbi:hypothetical protein [Arthrobacter sp. StoSoilB13]|uniref:hypothetical protein n=1 Tax=Arthrobacter sp. StoSoilB13 TaxID=2830993 RepID=UPI001CC38A6D|nr:hypothetical protein [Arthrobacter sp. StoSoilB13]BCW48099.1 hypothetical protein StoSoilB13_04410 [Arthrobacter sp. StoSoilB13]